MTDAPAPAAAPEPQPVATQPPPTPPAGNTLGLIGLILGGIGFVLAVIPPTSFIAWILLIPALVLGIVGLTRKGKKKGTSIAAVILGAVGLVVGIIVAVVTAVVGVGSVINDANSAPNSGSQSSNKASDAPHEAAIGDTVTNDDGIALTVTSVKCGISSAGEAPFQTKAKGQFCEEKFSLKNGGDESVNVSATDFSGYIGKAKYDADSSVSKFGPDLSDIISTDVNPGLSTSGVVYIDIPAGAKLDYVKYQGFLSLNPITVKVP